MRKSWRQIELGEVIAFLDHKRIPLNSHERAIRPGPYPYYGASGIVDHIDAYIFDGRYLLIAEDGENLNSRKLPIAFFADGKFWVNNHAHVIRGIEGLADDEYLKHWFAASNISGYITGAAQPKLSQANLRRVRIDLPPHEVQRRIAAILSAYDDLIENNARRIAILEEMARALYQEWFVHFRFPGHEHVPLAPSPLGPIPEGWVVKRLSDFADTHYGYTTSATNEVNGPKFLRGMDINKRTYIDWSTVPYCQTLPDDVARFKLRKGDVLIVRMADPGKVGIVEEDVEAVFASYLVRIRFDQTALPPGFVFQMLSSEQYQGYVTGASSGTTRKSIPAPAMTAFNFAIPALDVLQRYEEVAGPVRALLGSLVRQNANLRTTRDLLLPKLISGEITVSSLSEAPIAEAAD